MGRNAVSGAGEANLTKRILQVVIFNFLGYLVIGMQLSTLPALVHHRLGYSAVLAGLLISLQYVATLFTRSFAGRTCDEQGPRYSVRRGLIAYAISAVLMLLTDVLLGRPLLALAVLAVGRLALGMGESYVGTGCNAWGIGRVAAPDASKVISWSGIATYGGLAVGSPLGVVLQDAGGFIAIGICSALLILGALLWIRYQEDAARVPGKRLPIWQVFGRVAPYGLGLALGGCGFGVIATFITLYYAREHWNGSALTLSLFGGGFVAVRLLFGGCIPRYGGYRTAQVSFLVEAAGLVLLAACEQPLLAELGAVLAGMGFSLIFPALGVEAVNHLGASNRGAALAAYSVFVDVALGVTGPLGGLLANNGQYPALFAAAAACSVLAFGLSLALWLRYGRSAKPVT